MINGPALNAPPLQIPLCTAKGAVQVTTCGLTLFPALPWKH